MQTIITIYCADVVLYKPVGRTQRLLAETIIDPESKKEHDFSLALYQKSLGKKLPVIYAVLPAEYKATLNSLSLMRKFLSFCLLVHIVTPSTRSLMADDDEDLPSVNVVSHKSLSSRNSRQRNIFGTANMSYVCRC